MAANEDEVRRAAMAELARRELERRSGGERQIGAVAAGLNSLGQGLSFGFSDELAAGLSAIPRLMPGGKSFGDQYNEQLATERENLRLGREQHPWISGAGEVAGAVTTGIGSAAKFGATKTAQALARVLPGWAQLAGIGAVEGGLYGAGSAEEGERLEGAAKGAAVGAVAAPVVGGALKVGGRALKAGGRVAGRVLNNTPDNQAMRAIRKALTDDGFTPETALMRLEELGPEATLADLGENTSGLLRGATSKPGPGRQLARTFLDSRQRGQQARLLQAAGGDFDKGAFRRQVHNIVTSRQTRATPYYEEAYASAFDATSPRMQALLKRPMVASAMRKAETRLRNEGGGAGHVRVLDAAKRELDAMYQRAVRAGDRDLGRIIQQNKRALLDEVDRQVPSYKIARQLFSDETSIKNAINQGRDLFTGRVDIEVVEDALGAMSDGERHAFRLGALRGLVDKLDSTSETRNAAGKLVEGQRVKDLLRLAFPSDESVENFIRSANVEDVFSQTRNRVLGGSPTARIQDERTYLRDATQGLASIRSGDDLIAKGVNLLVKLGLGEDTADETLEAVSRLLMSRLDDPTVGRVVGAPRFPNLPSLDPLERRAASAGVANALVQQPTD